MKRRKKKTFSFVKEILLEEFLSFKDARSFVAVVISSSSREKFILI